MFLRTILFTSLAAAPIATAHAAAIIGGTTSVVLTSAPTLATLGVGVLGLGTATLQTTTPPTALFPITGGTLTAAGALIQHNGSGLELETASANVEATNFLIDTANGVIDANVGVNGGAASQLALFTLGTGTSATANIPLTLTSAAAAALDSVFGTQAFTTSIQIGLATTAPLVAAVPEPTSLAALGVALTTLFGLRRRSA